VIVISNQLALGDNLMNSTLAESYARLGHKVYLSSRTLPRNPGTRQLWELNQYIEGWSDEEPTAGLARLGEFWHRVSFRPADPIAHMEAVHGLPEPWNHYPRIYRDHSYIPDLSQTILVDTGSTSVPFTRDQIVEWLEQTILPRYRTYPIKQVVFSQPNVASHTVDLGIETVSVPDIYAYCDMIASCAVWCGVESGGQVMASAIRASSRSPHVHALFSTRGFNARMFLFPNVEYSVTQSPAFPDYQEPRPELDAWLAYQGRHRARTLYQEPDAA
jgi:hypothetical protein